MRRTVSAAFCDMAVDTWRICRSLSCCDAAILASACSRAAAAALSAASSSFSAFTNSSLVLVKSFLLLVAVAVLLAPSVVALSVSLTAFSILAYEASREFDDLVRFSKDRATDLIAESPMSSIFLNRSIIWSSAPRTAVGSRSSLYRTSRSSVVIAPLFAE